MSVKEARELDARLKMNWSEWEKKVDGLLRANGWRSWRDRVIPNVLLKEVPQHVRGQFQRYNRQAGLPDRLIAKEFPDLREVPPELYKLVGTGLAGSEFPVSLFGFVECKTGSGKVTAEQEAWLGLARMCPGMFGLVVYPADAGYLVQVLGGEGGAY